MNIQVRYQTNPEALANASVIFLDRRPLMRVSVILFNIIGCMYIVLVALKALMGLPVTFMELSLLTFCVAWVFGRRALTRRVLKFRLSKANPGAQVTIDISPNGIIWGGDGLKQGHLSWKEITHLIKTQNGYIVGTKISKFLWCPLDGFQSPDMATKFESSCQDNAIKMTQVNRSC